ncbi:MAG: universal stress protein, partial [Deltaproteobacteria bacterium]|nr:universal stress protein [Deltaproteobacteria bacterium]
MKFMVCYDGSEESKEALQAAQDHARIWGATLEVVNTLTRVEPLKHSAITKTENRLEAEVGEILGGDDPAYAVHLLVTDLTSGEQMVKFAEDEKISQIFIGIIKKSKVGKFLFGSTAQYVILHAPCPVVTIQE